MGVIFLVRHGQAEAGAYGVVGTAATEPAVPGSLTPLGVEQARATGAFLATQRIAITSAVSGELVRQQQTLAEVLGQLPDSPPVTVDPGWDEYSMPAEVVSASAEVFADGREYQRRLDAGLAAWVAGGEEAPLPSTTAATPSATSPGAEPPATSPPRAKSPRAESPGAESFADYTARIAAAGRRAADQAGSGQAVLVVSSAGTITRWVAELIGLPAEHWSKLARTIVNASVTKLLVGRGGVSVVSLNEHGHLTAADLQTYR